jgi:hypothetical protein
LFKTTHIGLRRRNRPIKTQDERKKVVRLENLRRRSQPTNLSLERSHVGEKKGRDRANNHLPQHGFCFWCIHKGLKRTTYYKGYMVKKMILDVINICNLITNKKKLYEEYLQFLLNDCIEKICINNVLNLSYYNYPITFL